MKNICEKMLIAYQKHTELDNELAVKRRLKQIEAEYEQYGYTVEKGSKGRIIVTTETEEIHFVPENTVIMEYIYGI